MLQRVITLCVWSRLPFSIIGGLFLLGCSKPILPADVAGTWVSSKASQAAIKSTNNYQLLFQADGTVMGSVPDFMIEAPDKPAEKPEEQAEERQV